MERLPRQLRFECATLGDVLQHRDQAGRTARIVDAGDGEVGPQHSAVRAHETLFDGHRFAHQRVQAGDHIVRHFTVFRRRKRIPPSPDQSHTVVAEQSFNGRVHFDEKAIEIEQRDRDCGLIEHGTQLCFAGANCVRRQSIVGDIAQNCEQIRSRNTG